MSAARNIESLPPAEVSKANRWFEIASLDYFWARRRFRVLPDFCDGLLSDAT